jgi:hypothetical protein
VIAPAHNEHPRPTMRRERSKLVLVGSVLALLALAGALAYLRDPPWLLTMSSGLRAWETNRDGTRFRWAAPHASFFVPADARDMRLRLRTTFDRPGEWPIAVAISIDDVPVDRLVLSGPAWRESNVRLPARGSRRVRRVDVRADRARDDNRAVQLGEVVLTH